MGIKLLNILAKPAKRMLSCADSKAVLEKAVKLGLAPEKVVEIKPLISSASRGEWLRQGQRILPENLGVYLSDGTLRFQSEEKAIEFGKKHIMDALHSAKPYEVNVDIAKDGRVLFKSVGDGGSVDAIGFDNQLREQIYTTMHGHPDFLPGELGKGITTAISTNDFEAMTMNKSIKKMIVFNSKGEHYMLTKLKGKDVKADEVFDILGDFSKDYANVRKTGHLEEVITGGYTRGAVLEEAYRLDNITRRLSSLEDIAKERGSGSSIGKIRTFVDRVLRGSNRKMNIYTKPARFRFGATCDLEERASSLFEMATENLYGDNVMQNAASAKEAIQKSHEFWKEFAAKYGVKMETNFSNFV